MPQDVISDPGSNLKEMLQAQCLMGVALFTASLSWQDKPDAVLAILAFCIFFATSVTALLSLIEGRLHAKAGKPLLRICLPATGVFGFSATLFVAAGFAGFALLVFLAGFLVAGYRRHATDGPFNLIPATALDVGLAGGLGATLAGLFLILLGWTFV
jgi:hypothetical protein